MVSNSWVSMRIKLFNSCKSLRHVSTHDKHTAYISNYYLELGKKIPSETTKRFWQNVASGCLWKMGDRVGSG